jgi:hypothetical protein
MPMSRPVRIRPLILGLAVWAGWAASLEAQVLEGRLLSMDRDRPISFGAVQLLTLDGEEVTRASTGVDGRFTLAAPEPGSYLVRGEAAFHRAWVEGPVELAPGQNLSVQFRLPHRAVALDPVEVTVEARLPNVARSGFYERSRWGRGHFFGARDIDRRRPFGTRQLLSPLPRVETRYVIGRGTVVLFRVPPTVRNLSGLCVPRVFLDGFVQPEFDLDSVLPEDIGGIEVYTSPAWVPPQYGGGLTGCGVILIWTRR